MSYAELKEGKHWGQKSFSTCLLYHFPPMNAHAHKHKNRTNLALNNNLTLRLRRLTGSVWTAGNSLCHYKTSIQRESEVKSHISIKLHWGTVLTTGFCLSRQCSHFLVASHSSCLYGKYSYSLQSTLTVADMCVCV